MEITLTICPYCYRKFQKIGAHLPYCKFNQNNIKKHKEKHREKLSNSMKKYWSNEENRKTKSKTMKEMNNIYWSNPENRKNRGIIYDDKQ